ncbi:MAG: hypothetical protein VXW32_00515 [Myxococcota bacterium]|nr:hypothetical protein [Myxococcota bacterium]
MALLGAAISACTTPCSSVCDKLMECESLGFGTISDKECELDCAVQESSYEDDEALDAAFEAYKSCVMEKSCEELQGGACYDSDLFAF